ncbi:hypothetical protein ACFRAO_20875 [Streptomyces sp. NPDC056656]|uniref:hypothetical protein n=1 Tax=Streptomyces sp. NPDC056656 TaxID=3345895 RepID=UPI00368CD734
MTPSWLPAAGEATRNVSYLIACNGHGHGPARAPCLGTLLADRLAGDDPHDGLNTVWRARPRFAPALVFNAPELHAMWAFDRRSDRKVRES